MGIPDFNTCRQQLNLPKLYSWSDLTSNVDIQNTFNQLYGDINNLDPYAGNHVKSIKVVFLTLNHFSSSNFRGGQNRSK
jgi:hypothetical protein